MEIIKYELIKRLCVEKEEKDKIWKIESGFMLIKYYIVVNILCYIFNIY